MALTGKIPNFAPAFIFMNKYASNFPLFCLRAFYESGGLFRISRFFLFRGLFQISRAFSDFAGFLKFHGLFRIRGLFRIFRAFLMNIAGFFLKMAACALPSSWI
jgi:hypothetical protein